MDRFRQNLQWVGLIPLKDKAVDRILIRNSSLKLQRTIEPEPIEDHVFLKANGKAYKIKYAEILYAEAQGNYTRIVGLHATVTPKMAFSTLEELLPSSFLRVHRSFLVNKVMISHMEGNRLFINEIEIPVGSNYRETTLRELGL